MISNDQLVLDLIKALKPLSYIYERYLDNGLDECRPDWEEGEEADLATELYSGRGGRNLLTLKDAKLAAIALMNYEERNVK